MRYGGPREFHPGEPGMLARELRELAKQVSDLFAAQQSGNAPQLEWADVARGDAGLELGRITPVQPGASLTLTTPPFDPRNTGKLCGVERRSTSGTVTMRPSAGGLLNDSAGPTTLATTARVYLFVQTPLGWKGVANA